MDEINLKKNNILNNIKEIQNKLNQALVYDKIYINKKLNKISKDFNKVNNYNKIENIIVSLEKRLNESIEKRLKKVELKPKIIFSEALPISLYKQEIIDTIIKNQVVIIEGDTGSGKSTQIPKMCIEAGRGIFGKIGCTQPRRIAAITIANRISEELNDSNNYVGYKIRFNDKTPVNAYIKIMTDGILLSEAQIDPYLNEYDTLIIDEAHERSLNIDFILGILKGLIKKRKDLKIIITSATIDTKKFSKFFNNAPVIKVSGKIFPVKTEYMDFDDNEEDNDLTHVEKSVQAVLYLWKKKRYGDILIFMPTEQDILDTCELLESKNILNAKIIPLYARLPASMQSNVFKSISSIKVIVSTNVAETSLTIPGIKYVIDTGLARLSQYKPSTRTKSLPVLPISKTSADQRKGRCGRLENGVCIRLYSEDDYNMRPQYTLPELQRSNLAEVILNMISLRIGKIEHFPFIDKPDSKSINDGFNLLFELGAIYKKKGKIQLTKNGRLMARIPVDPRISRVIIEAQKNECLKEIIAIASVMSIQDPRLRPPDHEKIADKMQLEFKDSNSDFLSLYNIWSKFQELNQEENSKSKIRKFLKIHFLSYVRMREWQDIYNQLFQILKSNNINVELTKQSNKDLYAKIHKSILSGFLSNIACKKEKFIFKATKGRQVMIFPGSFLFNSAGEWIVCSEIIETSRLFARYVANIESEWIEPAAKDLCKYQYFEPHFDKKSGNVIAYERVSLFGLIIYDKRPISYGPVNPDEASDIFIQNGLIDGNINESFDFLTHNQNIVDSITKIEDKIRRRDLFTSENVLFDFYKKQLGNTYNIFLLKKFLKNNSQSLKITRQMLLNYEPDKKELEKFPDYINFGNHSFKCEYNFDPGAKNDGVTVNIPEAKLHDTLSDLLDWPVSGLKKEKIMALIKGLPKSFRKQLMPLSKTADIIDEEMPYKMISFISCLSEFIFQRFKVDIPANVWTNITIDDYLKTRFSIRDHKGNEIRADRDIIALKQKNIQENKDISNQSSLMANAKNKWEKQNIVKWDFNDLPEKINIGDNLSVYPALVLNDDQLDICLLTDKKKALINHKKGICYLYSLHLKKEINYLKKQINFNSNLIYRYFNKNKIEDSIINSVLKELFYENIRTKEDFLKYASEKASNLIFIFEQLYSFLEKIFNQYIETINIINNLIGTNQSNNDLLKLFKSLVNDINNLLPDNFIEIYHKDNLCHIPRYLKAISIRAQRAAISYEKDRSKSLECDFFIKSILKLTQEINYRTSEEKTNEILSFFWMVEEYKVSLFAQELKTSVPVSKKRLEKKLKQIQRMI